jgi:hypothetical protein
VYVAPRRIVAVSLSRPGAAVLDRRTFEFDSPPGTEAASLQSALARVLREVPLRRLRVVLSSHLVQYRLLPWRDDLLDSDEDFAFARNQFANGHGDRTEDLTVTISHERPGRPRIAAAAETSIIAAIHGAAEEAGARIASLQPCLTAVAHSVREDLGQQPREWLVVHEDQKLSLALLDAGQWRWVRSLRVDTDWPSKLPALLAAESLRAGLDQEAEYAIAVDATGGSARLPDNASPRRPVSLAIRRQAPLLDGTEFAAALAGM